MAGAAGQVDLFTKRVRKAPAAPEFNLHCMVADVLDRWAERDWRWTHIASGELRSKATAGRLQRMGVKPGWADFILISPYGECYFLELKRRGGRLNEAQRDFACWCVDRGVPFELCDNFDAALKALKAWGALKVRVNA